MKEKRYIIHKSLEDYLGLVYTEDSDGRFFYDEHVERASSLVERLRRRVKKLEEKEKTRK